MGEHTDILSMESRGKVRKRDMFKQKCECVKGNPLECPRLPLLWAMNCSSSCWKTKRWRHFKV